ncbi:hypothetical protein ECDEC14C_2032 [Escherichia coli DEC14C]|nr:hypothetical protein ECDEC14C_2032 [Escherichia coli DEC14C]
MSPHLMHQTGLLTVWVWATCRHRRPRPYESGEQAYHLARLPEQFFGTCIGDNGFKFSCCGTHA